MHEFSCLSDIVTIENSVPLEQVLAFKTIYQCLSHTAQIHPNRNAVGFQLTSGAKDKKQTLNWLTLKQQVTQCANLFHTLGIDRHDVVACLLPNIPEMAITLLAGMTAGIIAPINPTLPTKQIAALLNKTNATVLVSLKAFPKSHIAQLTTEVLALTPCVKVVIEIDLLHHVSLPARWIVPFLRPKNIVNQHVRVLDFHTAVTQQNDDVLNFSDAHTNDICAYFHTGGTTGTPKIAQHQHAGVLYNGWVGGTLLYQKTDVVICPLPLFHVFAVYPIFVGCLYAGACMVLPTPAGYRGDGVFDNFWQLVERWQATFITTVPTAVSALLQRPVGHADISSLNGAICGSAPLPLDLFNRFQQVTGVEIIEGYGMTEATCLISCNPTNNNKGQCKVGSVGLPLPHTHVKILKCDQQGRVIREMKTNGVGEICVFNPGVNIDKVYTAEANNIGLFAKQNYLRTGDLGRIDANGYLWITGRAKDLIIRSGKNIDPALIEEILIKHPQVAFVGAIGQPDIKAGEVPCAYIELCDNANIVADRLLEYCRERILQPGACPKYIEIMPVLPKTAVGKIFKPDLRKSAIMRIYNAALSDAALLVHVTSVLDCKKRGLVAILEASEKIDNQKVKTVLGSFIPPWQWAEK